MVRLRPPIALIELGPSSRLDEAQLEALDEALRTCAASPGIRGIVLTGSSDAAFSEGLAPGALLSLATRRDAASLAQRASAVAQRVERCPVPVIAALHGPVLGAGLALALACTARVASDAGFTRLALDEAALGVVPVMRGLERLAEICGAARALALFESGARLSAYEALRAGLVDAVTTREQLQGAAARLALESPRPRARGRGWAARWADAAALAGARARASADPDQPALGWAAEVLSVSARRGARSSEQLATRAFAELAPSTPARARLELAREAAALRTRLRELRAAHGAPLRVAVVGASAAGAALAAAAVDAGAVVSFAERAEGLQAAQLVVEAARSDANERGRRALELLEATGPDTVLAVTDPPASLASMLGDTARGRSVVAVRVTRRLLELSALSASDSRALAYASLLAEAHPRAAVVTPDVTLGVAGRLERAFEREAEHLLEDGATRAEIADAALDWGFVPPEVRARRPGGPRRGRVAPEVAQARLALGVVNEAFRTLEDLRLEARAVDLAAVLGLGFPAFRGGPIAYAKSLGPSELSARVAQLRRRHGDRFAPAPALARLIARATAGA